MARKVFGKMIIDDHQDDNNPIGPSGGTGGSGVIFRQSGGSELKEHLKSGGSGVNGKFYSIISGKKVVAVSKEFKHDFKIEGLMNEIINKSAEALAEQIDDKMRPMITEALYRLNYTEHRQVKNGIVLDNDNSIMAKHIIKIMRDIFILFRNSDGERIKKKYSHKKY